MSEAFDCQQCGACCAYFRVSFHWTEGDDAPGGTVPAHLTHDINSTLRCMGGTQAKPVRCVALSGEIGQQVGCTIYPLRASTCKELTPGDEKCLKARAHHFQVLSSPKNASITS